MMKLRELLNGLDILETNAELDSDIREVRARAGGRRALRPGGGQPPGAGGGGRQSL